MSKKNNIEESGRKLVRALRKGGVGDFSKRWIEEWLADDVKPALEKFEEALGINGKEK